MNNINVILETQNFVILTNVKLKYVKQPVRLSLQVFHSRLKSIYGERKNGELVNIHVDEIFTKYDEISIKELKRLQHFSKKVWHNVRIKHSKIKVSI